MVIKSLSIKIV